MEVTSPCDLRQIRALRHLVNHFNGGTSGTGMGTTADFETSDRICLDSLNSVLNVVNPDILPGFVHRDREDRHLSLKLRKIKNRVLFDT